MTDEIRPGDIYHMISSVNHDESFVFAVAAGKIKNYTTFGTCRLVVLDKQGVADCLYYDDEATMRLLARCER